MPSPPVLVLDEAPNGQDLRCMRLGIAYRKRLLSVAAVCYPTDRPSMPMPMPKMIIRMLRQIAGLLPAGAAVTLLCDRGLSWPAVMDCARKLGFGHVMRLQRATRVTLADGRVVEAGELVKRPGGHWHGRARVFKKAGWRDAHVSVSWDSRGQEPRILAAREDGDPHGLYAAQAYAKRNGCEQTFRDEKSSGFRWADSPVKDAGRALKVVLVIVLSISLGTRLLQSGRRWDLDPHTRRRLSAVQLGLRWLHYVLVQDHDPPQPHSTCTPS